MTDELPPVPGPAAPWTGLIKTRKVDDKRKKVMQSVPFPPGLTVIKDFAFTKKDPAIAERERAKFDSSICGNWLKKLAEDPASVATLKAAGLTDADIEAMKDREPPPGYQVHHKLALDDGGTNDPSNFVLIKNDPYHTAITALHNSQCVRTPVGQTKIVDWPVPDGIIYPPAPEAPAAPPAPPA